MAKKELGFGEMLFTILLMANRLGTYNHGITEEFFDDAANSLVDPTEAKLKLMAQKLTEGKYEKGSQDGESNT